MVLKELAVEVMAEQPERALGELLELIDTLRADPRAWPWVADEGSVEEIREAWSALAEVQYEPIDGRVEIREIGWAG
ncbi:hypothetical protein GCM10010329_62330 [Streptomyces spiroverticillatus]|uniref:Uncharacterized protein n=1 Tax=Streptomyces finlayi TaxID=67296 RepID=A0A919CE39_9ACTN|nr:hypothetical protein [Streptomyces finlayi]GHA30540.1 hypothetical protein GCM10010329_62330 [Streptomyces spiroverticillatus]GHD14732.1 hypothetical protein GCM10010334_74100 [Streptomyces finlayi]